MDFLKHWGRWIQSERKARGYTPEDLARKTNLSTNQIYHIEKGRGDSRKETLVRIVNILGDENAYNMIRSYVELDIDDYVPLIRALEQLSPDDRRKGIQQILSILA